MCEKIIYPFRKTDGFVLPCKKGCTHCTDVFWDYSHGIYNTYCELDGEAPLCEFYENDGTEPITVEEFNKLKEKDDGEE